jgi:hypothetical protein
VDERDLEQVRFQELQADLGKQQVHGLNELTKALAAKPELVVELVPLVDSLAESGQLAVLMAKGQFLFPQRENLTAADSVQIGQLTAQDSSFVRWLEGRSPGTNDLAMPERCRHAIGPDAVMRSWQQLERKRQEKVTQYLIVAGIKQPRFRFAAATKAEMATYGGSPGYLFRYDAGDEAGTSSE